MRAACNSDTNRGLDRGGPFFENEEGAYRLPDIPGVQPQLGQRSWWVVTTGSKGVYLTAV